MKRSALLFLLLACSLNGVRAQDTSELGPDTPPAAEQPDTLAKRATVIDNGLMTVRSRDEGEMMLEFAGFGITLGRSSTEDYEMRKPSKVSMTLFQYIELGFTRLTGTSYAAYPASAGRFLDTEFGNSFHFSCGLIGLKVDLNRKRTLTFDANIQFTLDNYRLSDRSITLERIGDRLEPVALGEQMKKSKFVTGMIGVPVRLVYKPVKHLRLSAIAYTDFAVSFDTIYKKPRVQREMPLSTLNPCQFGLGASITYYGVGVFVRYNLTPLFGSGRGPECRPLSVGIALMM